MNKKRKILKISSHPLNINNVIDKSIFVSFSLLKYLNSYDCIRLKKDAFLLGLKILIPKSKSLKLKRLFSNFSFCPKGRIIIFYSNTFVFDLQLYKMLEFFKFNIKMTPLFFVFYNRLMYNKHLVMYSKINKSKIFNQLLFILSSHSQNLTNILIYSSKNLINLYEYYVSIKKK